MRNPFLLGLFTITLCHALPVHADLSVDDLPYVLGTPITEESWEIQEYAQSAEGIQWVWLQQGTRSTYVVYPSEEAALLPNNALVPANPDQVTLRFHGDDDQELLFTRFGSARFTLIGGDAEVRYTAAAANTSTGAYPGDLSMSAQEIHMEGELLLEGGVSVGAQEMFALYGAIDAQEQVELEAATGVILGSVKQNGALLLDACGHYSDMANIHFETSIKTKGCFGDLVLLPEADLVAYEPASDTSSLQANAQSTHQSKGGSTDGWLLALLAIFAGFVRVGRK